MERFLVSNGWSYHEGRKTWHNHRKYPEMYLSLWEALKIEGYFDNEVVKENEDKRLLHNRNMANYETRN